MSAQSSVPTFVYIGTYTRGTSTMQGRAEGIYVGQLDPTTGALTLVHTTPGVVNPSYLAIDPRHRYLYAVNEVLELDGQPSGGVSAFAIDPATGALTFLNRQLSHGTDPCHLTVDQTGQYVLVANYTSGSVAVLPIGSEGQLHDACDVHQHVGSSVHPQRQQGPHAHSINLDPSNRFALVCDLGLDQVLIYRFDPSRGTLTPHEPPSVSAAPGAGPRHLDVHPSRRFVYVINEIGSTLTAYAYDETRGTLSEIQSLSTLPPGFTGTNHTADVHVHPSGAFVYGSNRGHDSIVIFAVDARTGRLTYVGHESTRGQTPRNFGIDPTGTFLLAANQRTDTIVTFRIDQETGKLSPTGHVANVPTPVCLKFLQPER